MYDMGHESNTEATAEPQQPKKINYPSLSLSSAQFPDIRDWKIGQKYHLHLVVEQKGMNEDYDNKDEYRAEFNVLKAMSMKGGTVTSEKYKNMSSDEKDDADEQEVLGEGKS